MATIPQTHWFSGLKDADPKDDRDFLLPEKLRAGAPVNIQSLPERASVEADMPPVMDQKMISGCVGWAYVQAESQNRWAAQGRRGRRHAVLSPAFVYRECRALDEAGDPQAGIPPEPGSLAHDWGTYVRNAWKVGSKLGAPLYSIYPPKFDARNVADQSKDWMFPEGSVYRAQPQRFVYNDADDRQALTYLRCPTLADVLQSIAQGYAVQVGITIFRSFYGTNGPRFNVPMPVQGDAALGGHSICAIAYDRTGATPYVEYRNQWGGDAHIRDDGTRSPNFRLPFAYERWINDCWSGRFFER